MTDAVGLPFFKTLDFSGGRERASTLFSAKHLQCSKKVLSSRFCFEPCQCFLYVTSAGEVMFSS